MKRKFDFGCIDYEGKGAAHNRVTVEMEYRIEGDKKRFSVSASVWNVRHTDIVAGGQCLDTIAPYINNPVYSEILRLWELYHLNDMHPECEHQAAAGWRKKAGEKVTLYHWRMTREAMDEQKAAEKAALVALRCGETFKPTIKQRFFANLEYSLTTHTDTPPANVAKWYEPILGQAVRTRESLTYSKHLRKGGSFSMKVIKKDGTLEAFDGQKIVNAVTKSASRVMVTLTDTDFHNIVAAVVKIIEQQGLEEIPVSEMHNIMEQVLEDFNPKVAKSYKDYRNYKKDFVHLMDEVYIKSQSIRFIGDKENANTDSALVATKRCLIFNELNKRLYRRFFMTKDELQACKEGYIYIHDQSARLDTINCCLCDVGSIMEGGFEMGNVWYNEPKSLDTAFDVLGDIILATASQQYGGFTVPEVDKILAPYAEKSAMKYAEEYLEIAGDGDFDKANAYAMKKVEREFEQGFQGIEMKLNTVGSSRGDYPFITMTFGLATDTFGKMASKTFLRVHMNGQGKPGNKKPVLFPKLVFLYDENLHGEGCINEDVFEAGIQCSAKTMYPDWLSLTGDGYVASIYKKYGRVISPMGCRAFLSPWYERGGMTPADDDDKPVFVGRFNIGAVSLHLPMILAKARQESTDFYKVLDYYLEMIRSVHKRTYEYLGEMRASVNPIQFCEGGLYGGHLNPSDKIKPLLKPMTASFGITALNELQQLYNGKSIAEDGQFALEVMQYINDKVNQFKKEDGWLYAIYGTPAESLCGLQIEQFRKKYGVIENVSDRPYVSNSFHCHVTEELTPIQKQDLEGRFWDLCNGGKIQYVRYPVDYNIDAVRTLVRRAMKLGYYEGVNLSLAYCDDCGHQQLEMDVCPKCGSTNLTKIDRMNGYLSYSRVHGDTRLNAAKMAEIAERKSM